MHSQSIVQSLKRIPCFSCLNSEHLQKAASAVVERSYQKGDIIFLQDEPSPGLFVLEKGTLKLYRLSPSGREMVIHVAHAGQCLDCASLVGDVPNLVTAQAITDSNVYLLPEEDFQWLLHEEPIMTQQVARLLARKLRWLHTRLDDLNAPVEQRVGSLLLEMAGADEGRGKVVSLSQEELACLAGISRQRLNTYLNNLEKQGVIHKHRREIFIARAELLGTYFRTSSEPSSLSDRV